MISETEMEIKKVKDVVKEELSTFRADLLTTVREEIKLKVREEVETAIISAIKDSKSLSIAIKASHT